MPRDWDELVVTRKPARGEDDELDAEESERRGGRFARLRDSLRATRQTIGSDITATFTRTLADNDWEALEESLILADVGAPAAASISQSLEATARREHLDEESLRGRLVELLAELARGSADEDATIDVRAQPTVLLMVGVNGTGKTTTLAKLAWQLQQRFRLRVLLAGAELPD